MKILKGSLFKSSSRTNKHTEYDFGGFSELNVYNIISICHIWLKTGSNYNYWNCNGVYLSMLLLVILSPALSVIVIQLIKPSKQMAKCNFSILDTAHWNDAAVAFAVVAMTGPGK